MRRFVFYRFIQRFRVNLLPAKHAKNEEWREDSIGRNNDICRQAVPAMHVFTHDLYLKNWLEV
jgi:hypothetical protein